jgi:hypothetical protein
LDNRTISFPLTFGGWQSVGKIEPAWWWLVVVAFVVVVVVIVVVLYELFDL